MRSLPVKNLFFVLIALFISSCASRYEIPDGVPTAKVIFHATETPVSVQKFNNIDCEGVSILANFTRFNRPKQSIEVLVEAEKELIFTFWKKSPGDCKITTSFLPKEDATYRLSFYREGEECQLDAKIEMPDGTSTSIEGMKKHEKACYKRFIY